MYGSKGKPPNSVPSDSQAREKLALYVYEYLLHVGATGAAQTFLNEIRWDKNITLGEPPGFLHCWWSVFWDLYCAAPERRETCEHSTEAKAFHEYQNAACNPGAGGGGGGPPGIPNMMGHLSPGAPGPGPPGPDGIPVTGGPHPMFFHSPFGPRGYPRPGMARPMSQSMPGQPMMGPGPPNSMDPSRPPGAPQDMMGPHGPHSGMGLSPRMGVPGGPGGPPRGPPMMSPQFGGMRPQSMPPSSNPLPNRMSPRPWSRMSPGPNGGGAGGPGTPIMQPSPQPGDPSGGPPSEAAAAAAAAAAFAMQRSGGGGTGGPPSNGGPPTQGMGGVGPPVSNAPGGFMGGGPGPGPGGGEPMQTCPPTSQPGPAGANGEPQPGDNMESAAILKIKESMQEEAKLFEKPDDAAAAAAAAQAMSNEYFS